MTPGRKLILAGAVVAAVTIYMAFAGASASWQYYLTADECLARADTLAKDRLRVGGKVALKTLQVSSDRRQIAFTFQTAQGRLAVHCAGPPPDNLVEGMDVVVEGRLEGPGLLQGEKLLTRCASKYKSPSAAASGEPSDVAAARRP
jgi:cytochrome c-type biogenesis protein CcmE